MEALRQFRTAVQALIPQSQIHSLRPFVCHGSPLDCRVFIVGENPATKLSSPFWQFWSDESGFDKNEWLEEYKKKKKSPGSRRVIQALADQFPLGWCLETNLYSLPAPSANQLQEVDRKSDIFEYLFHRIKPEIVFAHGRKAIGFFERQTAGTGFEDDLVEVDWLGHRFRVHGRPGPLYTLGQENAKSLGRWLASDLWAHGDIRRDSLSDLPRIAQMVTERFHQWRFGIPKSDLQNRRSGRFFKDGWWLLYRFGEDREGEYLDYYASHRLMAGDEHVRIYESGRQRMLPTPAVFCPVSDDPSETERLKKEFSEHNAEINRILQEKGFGF